MQSTPSDRLVDCLDSVFVSLREGRLDGLGDLAAQLWSELDQLDGADADALDVIHRRALRNAACLEAAARGVRSARRRLAEIRGIESGMPTYDAKGRRDELAPPSGRLTQRL